MLTDIGLSLDTNRKGFTIIDQSDTDMPPIIQAAITILFLSNNESFRTSFEGLYNIIRGTNNNVIEALRLELAEVSFKLTEALQQTYIEVESTDFETEIEDELLRITLNIKTTTDIVSSVIYVQTI